MQAELKHYHTLILIGIRNTYEKRVSFSLNIYLKSSFEFHCNNFCMESRFHSLIFLGEMFSIPYIFHRIILEMSGRDETQVTIDFKTGDKGKT